MIDYVLTKHAKKRLFDRKISVKLLETALSDPTQVLADGTGKLLYQKLYRERDKSRLLMVVVIIELGRLKVLTVIDTSKVKKYLKK